MKYKKSVSCIFAFLLLAGVASGDMDTTNKKKQRSIDFAGPYNYAKEILRTSDPVWEHNGYELEKDGVVVSSTATVVYVPFLSSRNLCRAYATTYSSPSWVCDATCGKDDVYGYDISTKAFVAEVADGVVDCASIKFSENYIKLESDLSDEVVLALLRKFVDAIDNWKLILVDKGISESEYIDAITARDIESITALQSDGDGFVVDFAMKARFKSSATLILTVRIKDNVIVGYDVRKKLP